MYKLSEERTDYTDYIEKNQLEYPILNMLLFNDMGFSFFIMQDPEIRSLNNEFCITVNREYSCQSRAVSNIQKYGWP